MLNHTGLLKAARWVTRMYFNSLREGLLLVVVDEVAPLVPPAGDRVGDPVDHLLQRRLPFRRAERAAEVLLGDDVGGVQRPAHGELDPGLLEGDRAVLPVRDAGIPALPHDLVVGVDARRREQAAQANRESFGRQRHRDLSFNHRGSGSVPGPPSGDTTSGGRSPAAGHQTTSSCGWGTRLHHRSYGVVNTHEKTPRINAAGGAAAQVRGPRPPGPIVLAPRGSAVRSACRTAAGTPST